MQRNNFTAILPATRCTEDMRRDVEEVADAAGVDKADVIRDALEAFLPGAKLSLGIIQPEDLSEEFLASLGITRQADPQDRSVGCWGADKTQAES